MIPFSRSSKFVALCETRGAERYEAVIVFIELFAAMLNALQEIEISDALASVNAEGLKLRTLNPDFIYSLKIFEHIFAMTLPLSTALESKDTDIFSCCEMVDDIKVQIQREMSSIIEFATIFDEGSALIKKLEIPITSRGGRLLGIGDNAQVRISENVFKPFLERLPVEMEQRFGRIFAQAARGYISIIPHYMAKGSTPVSTCSFLIFKPACFSDHRDNRTIDEDSDFRRLYLDDLDHRPGLKPEIAR